MTIRFDFLEKALFALRMIVKEPIHEDRSNIDASTHRFKLCFDLFGQLLKRLLEQNGLEVTLPKPVLQAAYAAYFIEDEKIWLAMLQDRNLSSHTYDEALADEIYCHIQDYYPIMQATFDKLVQQYHLR